MINLTSYLDIGLTTTLFIGSDLQLILASFILLSANSIKSQADIFKNLLLGSFDSVFYSYFGTFELERRYNL